MPERGSVFALGLWGVRLCALRSLVLVAMAAGAASTGDAPPAEACTFKPNGPAPQGRHWYYMLDRAKRHCWHLGPLGLAAQSSAARRLRHRAAAAHARPVASETAAAGPATAPAAPQPTAAESVAARAAVNGADALAPALPTPEAADVSERWLAAEPAPQGSAGETRSPDPVAAEPAVMPASMPAPETAPPEAPQPAATPLPAWAAAVAGGYDRTFAPIVVAAALLVIAGPMLWAMRRWSGRRAGGGTPSAPQLRPARVDAPSPLVLARTAVRHRRPRSARDQATEEIGPPQLPEPSGATRPSP